MRHDWAALAAERREEPGTWAVIATDVPVGIADYVRKQYGLEVRLEGIDTTRHRAGLLHARHPVDGARQYWASSATTITSDRGEVARFHSSKTCQAGLLMLREGSLSHEQLRWN